MRYMQQHALHVTTCATCNNMRYLSKPHQTVLLLFQSVGLAETHRAHCSLSKLIVPSPAFSSPIHLQRCSTSERHDRPLSAKGRIMGKKWPTKFSLTVRLPRQCRVLKHAANLRHGTDGLTSPPKEGMPRIFSLKNPTASARFEPVILGTRGQHANH
jgi:hypothetical protein